MSKKASKPVPVCKKCHEAHYGYQKCPANIDEGKDALESPAEPLTPEEEKEAAVRETIDNDPMENEVLAEKLAPKSDAEWKQAEADDYFMKLAAGDHLNAYQLQTMRDHNMVGPDGIKCPEHEVTLDESEGCKYCTALAG